MQCGEVLMDLENGGEVFCRFNLKMVKRGRRQDFLVHGGYAASRDGSSSVLSQNEFTRTT
jgi:hypothetical protein